MSTEQDWLATILKMVDEVRAAGHEPTKIIIPLHVQRLMSFSFFPYRDPSKVTTFYGYPVEDGPEIAVEWDKKGYDDQHYILSIVKEGEHDR